MGELLKILEFIERQGLLAGSALLLEVLMVFITYKWISIRFDKKFNAVLDQNSKLSDQLLKSKDDISNMIQSNKQDIIDKETAKAMYIKNNPYFSGMEYYSNVKIHSLMFQNEFKKEVFTDILRFLINSSVRNTKNYVDNIYNSHIDDVLFQSQIINISKETYVEFLNNCKLSGIPPLVIRKFNNWAAPLMRFLFSSIENICSSSHYESINDKLIAILFIKYSVYGEIIDNLEVFLDKLNGDFDGLIYKGIVCGE